MMKDNLAIDGLIWDVDGTLVDSEDELQQEMVDLLCEKYGLIPADIEAALPSWTGKTNEAILTAIGNGCRLDLPKDAINEEWTLRVVEKRRTQAARPVPGALDLVKAMAARFRQAAVSNGETEIVHLTLLQGGYGPYMAHIATQRDGLRGKPAPDLLWDAAKHLETAPDRMAIVGDSMADFGAAAAAGMKFIAFLGAVRDPDAAEAEMRAFGTPAAVIRDYSLFPLL